MSRAKDPTIDTAPVELHRATSGGVAEVAATFLKLGCFSFGGPIAMAAAGQWLL